MINYITNGDFSFPLILQSYVNKLFYIWSYSNGTPNVDSIIRFIVSVPTLLVYSLTKSNVLTSYSYILLISLISFASFYYFIGNFFNIRDQKIKIVSALLFALNPAFLGNYSKTGLVLAASMLPLILVFIKKLFETHKFKYIFFLIVCLNVSFVHPFTLSINIFVAIFYSIYLIVKNHSNLIWIVKRLPIILLLFFAINSYFVLPLLKLHTVNKSVLSQDIGNPISDSSNLVTVANTGNLTNSYSLSKPVLLDFNFYNSFYRPFFFVATFGVYILLLSLYLYVAKKFTKHEKKYVIILFLILLLLLILPTGTLLGVDRVHYFLVGLPGGWAFRSPLKWQLYIPIVLASLVALIGIKLKLYERKFFTFGILILILIMNSYVLFDIYHKLLVPKIANQYTELNNVDLKYKRVLYVYNDACLDYEQHNPISVSELKSVLAAKDVQLKKISVTNISEVSLDNFNYVIYCHTSEVQPPEIKYLKKVSTLANGQIELLKNDNSVKNVYAFDDLFYTNKTISMPSLTKFADDNFKAPFQFSTQQDTTYPSRKITDIFGDLSAKDISGKHIKLNVNVLKPSKMYFDSTQYKIYQTKSNVLSINSGNEQSKTTNNQKEVKPDNNINSGNYSVEFTDENLISGNYIKNNSFESGTWQKKVGDCFAYDKNPALKMSLVDHDAIDSNHSLELAAKQHIACTGPPSIKVKAGSTYLLNFSYKSLTKGAAGYNLQFDNSAKTSFSDRFFDENKDSWHEVRKQIKVPDGAKTANLTIYAYPELEFINYGVVRYDNFYFGEIPDVASKFYILEDSDSSLLTPSISYYNINPTKKYIHISNAKTPFYLALNDSFHTNWELVQQKKYIFPWSVKTVPNSIHFINSNVANGWYIDVNKLCKNYNNCKQNKDGSYDIDLAIEFTPQNWYEFGLLITALTFIGCISYIFYDNVNRQKS